jgi:pimeloyl-ACP methyl ester carboxylesterase
VLLHGFATSAHLWRQVIPRVPSGHRVVALDLAGHGRSEPPAAAEPHVAQHAQLTQRLLDELQTGPVHVVAHGCGCEIALALAAQPGRVHSLLLIAPAGSGQRLPATPAGRSRASLALRLPWGSPAIAPLRSFLARGYVNAALAERSLGRHLQWFRDRDRRTTLMRQLRALADEEAAPVQLEQPFELLTGGADPFVSVRRVGARFLSPGRGTHTTLGGERHFLPEEAPDTVAKVLARLLGS